VSGPKEREADPRTSPESVAFAAGGAPVAGAPGPIAAGQGASGEGPVRAQGPMTPPAAQPTPEPAVASRGPDRRSRPTPRFSRYALSGGRRKHIRRESEREGSFVDLYDTRIWLVVMWVALLNVADSFFTLVHLHGGGSEANPVAAALLTTGTIPFVLLKSGVIAVALVVLCIHKNFRLARVGLWIAASAYTLLLGYHLLLFWR
jgi:hypothetical protein